MKAEILALIACVTAAGLVSCTTEPKTDALGPTPGSVPEPEMSVELPLERETVPVFAPPQACLLGSTKSCMELDPRPFEPCLVGGKDCEREGVRAIPVAPAVLVAPDAVE